MGPASLKRLLKLPLEAIEFGALGGTNFTKLELHRLNNGEASHFDPLSNIGHTAVEMTSFINKIAEQKPVNCRQLIISGGITNIPDGYYLTRVSKLNSVFGMGSAFLKYAMGDYEPLRNFVIQIEKALSITRQFLVPVQ
jgi:isopentenyl-diphosphate delta-isomerase